MKTRDFLKIDFTKYNMSNLGYYFSCRSCGGENIVWDATFSDTIIKVFCNYCGKTHEFYFRPSEVYSLTKLSIVKIWIKGEYINEDNK